MLLMMWGPVAFSIAPLNADRISIDNDTVFAAHAVAGSPPVYEHTGEGERSITIRGAVFPEHLGGLANLEMLETLREQGEPQHLIRGDGRMMGWCILDKVSQEHEHLNGMGVGRAISYTLKLQRCEPPQSYGSIFNIISGLL